MRATDVIPVIAFNWTVITSQFGFINKARFIRFIKRHTRHRSIRIIYQVEIRVEMNPSMFHPSGFLIISLFSTAKPAPAFLRDNCNLPLELYHV